MGGTFSGKGRGKATLEQMRGRERRGGQGRGRELIFRASILKQDGSPKVSFLFSSIRALRDEHLQVLLKELLQEVHTRTHRLDHPNIQTKSNEIQINGNNFSLCLF